MSYHSETESESEWKAKGVYIFFIISTVILFILFITIVPRIIDRFDLSNDEAIATIIAAAIALFGTIITALISFIGLQIKETYNKRTYHLQVEAEERLKMDTEIKAVDLLGTSTGNDSAQKQRAGALFALSNLGRRQFALALLESMWDDLQLTSCMWVINDCLCSENKKDRAYAAKIYYHKIDKMIISKPEDIDNAFPNCYEYYWESDNSFQVRYLVMSSLLKLIEKSIPLFANKQNREYMNFLVTTLYVIQNEEENNEEEMIEAAAIFCLDKFMFRYPKDKNLKCGEKSVNTKDFKSIIKKKKPQLKEKWSVENDRIISEIEKELAHYP